MKKLIVLISICCTYCNIWSCRSGNDTSNCESKELGISGYSCSKFKSPYNYENPYYCSAYPEKAEEQKIYWKLNRGLAKEAYSSSKSFNNFNGKYSIGEKDYYKKGEVVTLKNATFSEEDKKIFEKKNTCSYKLTGRYFDNLELYREGYPNITDPNICFNVDNFNELNGILNCGFANISYTIDNKTHSFTSCLLSIGNKASKDTGKFYKAIYFDELGDSEISIFHMLVKGIELISLTNRFRKNYNLKNNQIIKSKRQLDELEIQNYEIIIEDKNGKITKYSKDFDDVQEINSGNQVDDDDNDDDIVDIRGSNSKILRLNIFISLILIILNL